MSLPSLEVAQYICRKTNWSISNLELQKYLYLAHMFSLGEFNKPLIDGHFEAWYYGPVHPRVYHQFKVFGADLIKGFEYIEDHKVESNKQVVWLISAMVQMLESNQPWQLVELTHWKNGAWSKKYNPDHPVQILNEDILEEYHARKSEE